MVNATSNKSEARFTCRHLSLLIVAYRYAAEWHGQRHLEKLGDAHGAAGGELLNNFSIKLIMLLISQGNLTI